MRSIRCAIVVALVLVSVPTLANNIKHPEAGVGFVLPDEWKSTMEGDILVTLAPDEKAMMLFTATDDPATHMGELDAFFTEQGCEGTWTELEDMELNGLEASGMDGEGTCDDAPMDFSLLIASAEGKDKVVFMVALMPKGDKTHVETMQKVIASMKAL